MFNAITNSPNFSFAVSPSGTELENVVSDWNVQALGLPEKFLFKGQGGGIINTSAAESIFNSVHIAKYAKRKELEIELDDPRILKLVGYFGEGSFIGC